MTEFENFENSFVKLVFRDGDTVVAKRGELVSIGEKFVELKTKENDILVNSEGFVNAFKHAEVHFNRVPALGLGRSGLGSWISTGLHVLVDGESHTWPITRLVEPWRNMAVDITERCYQIRRHYVY